MTEATNIVIYGLLFLSLYFEVFMLITYFEKRMVLKQENAMAKRGLRRYPSVTFIVPCWNEEFTISKTIHSLLDMDYPKDKLKIIIVDDGSTDNTWDVIQKFAQKKQVEIYHKENGGKHTALNLGLSKTTSDLVGCLDADSYVTKDTLKNLVVYFEDKKIMAVTPSVKVWKPKNIIQLMQKVEYGWGIFMRKMFSYVDGLYVTPGPASIFRKQVFDTLGTYRYAHQTEDMEMALRMQTNHYKIANAHNAFVYTVAPETVRKLYRQKLRWTYGFIKNVVDYRFLFFKKKYGNLGLFVLPVASISLITSLYVAAVSVFHLWQSATREFIKFQTIGFNFHWPDMAFDWFSINTEYVAVLSMTAFLLFLITIFISRKMAEGDMKPGLDIIYFMMLYSVIAPFWIAKAFYNAIFSVKTYWR